MIGKDSIYTAFGIIGFICVFVLIGMLILLSLNLNWINNNIFIIIGFTAIILLCLSLAFLEDDIETERENERIKQIDRQCKRMEEVKKK